MKIKLFGKSAKGRTFDADKAQDFGKKPGLEKTRDANGTLARSDRGALTVADIIDELLKLPMDAVMRGSGATGDVHYAKVVTWNMLRHAEPGDASYVKDAGNRVPDENDTTLRFSISFW